MMNDTPSLASAWDLAHARCAPDDELRREQLRIACGLHLPRAERLEQERLARLAAEQASQRERDRRRAERHKIKSRVPRWPAWARDLKHRQPGHCAACDLPLHPRNATGICGKCSTRAGRESPRMRAALAEYLGREP